MTKEHAAEWVNLFQGVVDGGELQYSVGNGAGVEWVSSRIPDYSLSPQRYRIKPAQKIRPWKCAEEVPVGCLMREKTYPEIVYLLLSHRPGYVVVATEPSQAKFSYEQVFDVFSHSTDGGKTWKPCGVEE